MKYLIAAILCYACFVSCKKYDPDKNGECNSPAVVPYQPFTEPIWHPNGQLIGFNHAPLTGVTQNGSGRCIWFMNGIKSDSVGFYLMNKNGTGFKRVTNYKLTLPTWSKDGNWLAFSLGNQIYKMPYDGINLDTAAMVLLTNQGSNYNPSYTTNNDTIYYDSNKDHPTGNYSIWKMAADGSGKTMVIPDARLPFVGSDNRIYFMKYVNTQPEIFSSDKMGTSLQQLTFNSSRGIRRAPRYFQNTLLFWDVDITSTNLNPYSPVKLVQADENYDISVNAEIVYATTEFSITDIRFGTLWTMNLDGTNKKQITFNNY